MSNEGFILLAFIIPALLCVLGLLFKMLFGVARLERRLSEIAFEVRNLREPVKQDPEDAKSGRQRSE